MSDIEKAQKDLDLAREQLIAKDDFEIYKLSYEKYKQESLSFYISDVMKNVTQELLKAKIEYSSYLELVKIYTSLNDAIKNDIKFLESLHNPVESKPLIAIQQNANINNNNSQQSNATNRNIDAAIVANELIKTMRKDISDNGSGDTKEISGYDFLKDASYFDKEI